MKAPPLHPGPSRWVQGHMIDISKDLQGHSRSRGAAGFPVAQAAPPEAEWTPPTLRKALKYEEGRAPTKHLSPPPFHLLLLSVIFKSDIELLCKRMEVVKLIILRGNSSTDCHLAD